MWAPVPAAMEFRAEALAPVPNATPEVAFLSTLAPSPIATPELANLSTVAALPKAVALLLAIVEAFVPIAMLLEE